MIRTQQTRVPWLWVAVILLPIFGIRLVDFIAQTLLAFTLDKHTNDPSVITFLTSVNVLFNVLVAPFIAWKSDRIWTRYGRRKPFVIIGWIGIAVLIAFIPDAPTLWLVGLLIIGYNFFQDLNTSVYQPLIMEVVPPPQRGRMQAARQGIILVCAMYFQWMIIRNFDKVTRFDLSFLGLGKVLINGEQVAYWVISAVVLCCVVMIGFSVNETKPKSIPNLNERFSPKAFISSVFMSKEQLKVYLLSFALMAMGMGIGSLSALLVTKQFGYSKEQMGEWYFWLKIFQFFLVLPFAGYIADRFDRIKMFLFGISMSTIYPLAYWAYIHFVAPNNIPSPYAIIGFTGFDIIVDFTVQIAMIPLIFDYIPRNRMGTMAAGMSICDGLAKFILMNGVGLFVKYYSMIFCPPGIIDYSSGYLFVFLVGCVGTACGFYFLHEKNAGRVIPYGKLEHEELVKQEALKKAAAPEEVETPAS